MAFNRRLRGLDRKHEQDQRQLIRDTRTLWQRFLCQSCQCGYLVGGIDRRCISFARGVGFVFFRGRPFFYRGVLPTNHFTFSHALKFAFTGLW